MILKNISIDYSRPWCDIFVIVKQQLIFVANTYFYKLNILSLKISGNVNPKILTWQHLNSNILSDKVDIARVQNYFGK